VKLDHLMTLSMSYATTVQKEHMRVTNYCSGNRYCLSFVANILYIFSIKRLVNRLSFFYTVQKSVKKY
jgi:hypothetical protein